MLEARKAYHATLNITWILRQPAADLDGMFKESATGRLLSARDVLDVCIVALRDGFDVLPTCDHHDDRGYCLGHPVEDKSHEPDAPGQDHSAPGISDVPATAGNRDEATQGEAADTEPEAIPDKS